MLRTNPVGVGKIYSDGCRRIFVASQHGSHNHIGGHAPHLFLLEAGVHGRVVLKPLGVGADLVRALVCLLVLIGDNSLPRGLEAQRVAIDLYETVYEIDVARVLLQPLYRIAVEGLEVARAIIAYEQPYHLLLLLVLGKLHGFCEPIDNAVYCFSIHSALLPYLFLYVT